VGGQSGDALLTPWGGKAGTLRLPPGRQSRDASLTPGEAKQGRFAYPWGTHVTDSMPCHFPDPAANFDLSSGHKRFIRNNPSPPCG
jgi:hypothetical protein